LELFNLGVSENLDLILPLVTSAFETLLRVQSRPSLAPSNESPATSVFDTRVSRRLHTVIPIRVVELPEQTAVWSAVEQLLHGWADVDYLRDSSTISTWQVRTSPR
jgi:N-alpha-acetyltransferase 35, NatC auxiliary subunit